MPRGEPNPFAFATAQLQWAAFAMGGVSFALALVVFIAPTAGGVLIGATIVVLALLSAGVAVSRMCLPGNRRRHWAAFWLAVLGPAVYVLTIGPDAFAIFAVAFIVLFHVAGGLVQTARIRREPHFDPRHPRRQLLLLWCCPIVGFLIVSAYYLHLDEPKVHDGFDAEPGRQSPE